LRRRTAVRPWVGEIRSERRKESTNICEPFEEQPSVCNGETATESDQTLILMNDQLFG